MGEHRPRLNDTEYALIQSLRANGSNQEHYHRDLFKNENEILIGDLHCPFDLDAYLDHCLDVAHKFNVGRVTFMGDVIDNHYSSYHETDPDGMGGGDELDYAITRLQRYYKAFPDAKVIIGNHDRIIMRKAFTGGIPKRWIKDFADVLECPRWEFVDSFEHNNVLRVHGDGGSRAIVRARRNMESTICGHFHTDMYVQYLVGSNFKIFGAQVGCGVDRKAHAMAYAKHHPKPAIGCMVLLNDGKLPVNIPMEL